MATHLYSIEQVAELLNLHVKTVRRYVHTGRLKAKRIGKQYRITRPDLDEFAGTDHAAEAQPVRRTRHVVASTVLDADAVSQSVSDRITTMVMASLNVRKGEEDSPRVDCIYYPEHAKLRITITSSPVLTCDMLRMISGLLEAGRE
jgi:excisionase family DNA binding protein